MEGCQLKELALKAGGLAGHKEKYNSRELQKESLNWWGD
jgi:hypothetical protein